MAKKNSPARRSRLHSLRISPKDRTWIRRRLKEIRSFYDLAINDPARRSPAPGFLSIFYLLYSDIFDDESARQTALLLRNQTELTLLHKRGRDASPILSPPYEGFIALKLWHERNLSSDFYDSMLASSLPKKLLWAPQQTRAHGPELLYGATGFAIAAQHIGNIQLLKRYLDRIEKALKVSPWGLAFWPSQSYRESHQEITGSNKPFLLPGLSHGIAGLLAFLCHLARHDCEKRRALKLATGLAKTLLEIQSLNQGPSFKEAFPTGLSDLSSWCHGDAGVGFALTLMQGNTARAGQSIFLRGTDPLKWQSRVEFEHICHGFSGLAQMCLRYYQTSGHKVAAKHYLYWLRRLNKPIKRYAILSEQSAQTFDTLGPLTGLLGVGLTLISSLKEDDMNWDRIFLLSGMVQNGRGL